MNKLITHLRGKESSCINKQKIRCFSMHVLSYTLCLIHIFLIIIKTILLFMIWIERIDYFYRIILIGGLIICLISSSVVISYAMT